MVGIPLCYVWYSIVSQDLAHTLHSAYSLFLCWNPLTDSPQTTYASLPARVICCQNAAHTTGVPGCICALGLWGWFEKELTMDIGLCPQKARTKEKDPR